MTNRSSLLAGRIVRYSIVPLLLVANILYFVDWIGYASRCTGTGSAYFATTYLCRKSDDVVALDCIGVSLLILIVWISGPNNRFMNVVRVLALVWLFIGRFLVVESMADTYVVPFYP